MMGDCRAWRVEIGLLYIEFAAQSRAGFNRFQAELVQEQIAKAMATTPEADEKQAIASHTLAYLRALDKKVDLLIDAAQRHQERLARVERDLGETRRDVVEVKGDIALLENKVLTAQTEMLAILRRLAGETEVPASE